MLFGDGSGWIGSMALLSICKGQIASEAILFTNLNKNIIATNVVCQGQICCCGDLFSAVLLAMFFHLGADQGFVEVAKGVHLPCPAQNAARTVGVENGQITAAIVIEFLECQFQTVL